MAKKYILFSVIAICLLLVWKNPIFIYEQQLKADYFSLMDTTIKLFQHHANKDGYYYNNSYHTKNDLYELLGNKVTKQGFNTIVNEVFEKREGTYFYKDDLQTYLNGAFYEASYDVTYYQTVSETILNPALTLISFDQVEVRKENNRIVLEGNEIPIRFYQEGESKYHPYARYGYPPHTSLSVSFEFLYKDGRHLLDDYNIEEGTL